MTHVSPSQLSTFGTLIGRSLGWNVLLTGCPRKWAYSRCRPKTTNKWAAFGDRSHAILESWLRDGTPPDPATDEGACVLAGLHLLPMPGTACVETTINFLTDGVNVIPGKPTGVLPYPWVHYTGRLDLLAWYQPGVEVTVSDHKTTGDLANAKCPEDPPPDKPDKDLRTDPQRIVYSFAAGHLLRVPRVRAQWTYFRRKPPKAEPSIFVERLEDTARRFWEMHWSVAVPLVRSQGMAPETMPRNLEHCRAFGGCPYRGECLQGASQIDQAFAQIRTARAA